VYYPFVEFRIYHIFCKKQVKKNEKSSTKGKKFNRLKFDFSQGLDQGGGREL
jgi:hypothetical protein